MSPGAAWQAGDVPDRCQRASADPRSTRNTRCSSGYPPRYFRRRVDSRGFGYGIWRVGAVPGEQRRSTGFLRDSERRPRCWCTVGLRDRSACLVLSEGACRARCRCGHRLGAALRCAARIWWAARRLYGNHRCAQAQHARAFDRAIDRCGRAGCVPACITNTRAAYPP